MFAVADVSQVPVEIHPDEPDLRAKIMRLEAAMLATCERAEFPTMHHFSKGIYAREITIPKGSLLVGKIHRFSNLNIVSKGDITVLTENGLVRVMAPCTFVSPPGVKRVGYAHEDTVWTCVHATGDIGDSTDLAVIEDMMIAPDFDQVAHELKIVELPELGGAE